jgi:hypothetical protein
MLNQELKRFCQYKLIIIDEIGYDAVYSNNIFIRIVKDKNPEFSFFLAPILRHERLPGNPLNFC